MDISGSYTVNAPRERVWENLLDPDMLQRTIPGCEKLEQIGPDEWRMRVNIGIAAVKGTYEGTLRMTERVAPEHYRMVADGTGARSMLHGEGTLTLEAADPSTTVVRYQGEAQINGPLAGIANRVAGSVSRMLINQFFGRFQRELDAKAASAPAEIPAPGTDGATAAVTATPAAPADDAIFDASTSGVWEMSLPEARPLDEEHSPATALPLDSAPAATGAATPSVPAAPTAAPEAASATTASAPTAPAPATPATPSTAQPATTSTPAGIAPIAMAATSTSASATMSTGQHAGGGFMAWLVRLFGRAR